jgi:6-phosphogluconolactonase
MIQIFTDKEALTRAAVELIVTLATEAVVDRGRFTIALSGGSTPQALFMRLAAAPFRAKLPWPAMQFFWGDERLVAADDPGSNYYHAAKLLLDHVPVPEENIHRVRGELDQEAAVNDYRRQLRANAGSDRPWPRFDLVLLGLGSDGHTASLFPGPTVTDQAQTGVKRVTADYEGRPAARITLTPAVFNDARHLLFLVTGANKAAAVAAVLEGGYAPEQWPAQLIQPRDGLVTWFIDQAAAANLSEEK